MEEAVRELMERQTGIGIKAMVKCIRAERPELADADVTIGHGHMNVLGGHTLWCIRCGAFADVRASGLTEACKGPPLHVQQGRYGGRWGSMGLSRGSIPLKSLYQ